MSCSPTREGALQNVSENVVLKIQRDAYRIFQGLVTSVQKLNRKGLQDKYKEAINKACGKLAGQQNTVSNGRRHEDMKCERWRLVTSGRF